MKNKKAALQSGYITVKRSGSGELTFGGDQNFFAQRDKTDSESQNTQAAVKKSGNVSVKTSFRKLPEDAKKQKMGCGIVALSDIFLYLSGKNNQALAVKNKSYVNRELNEKEYRDYYNVIYTFVGKITKYGISGLKLWQKFNQMARRQGWRERAFWGMSKRKMLPRIEEMLSKDIPVILCIPMAVRKKDKAYRLSFYKKDEKGSYILTTNTSGHYVVVTEIFYEENEIYLVISSWGKQYFVKWKEYEQMIEQLFLGAVFGNLLYIR